MTLQQTSAVIQCDWFRVAGDGSGTVQYGKAVNTEQQGILMSWREEGDKQTYSYGPNSTATIRMSRPRERGSTPWSVVGAQWGTECSQRRCELHEENATCELTNECGNPSPLSQVPPWLGKRRRALGPVWPQDNTLAITLPSPRLHPPSA